MKLLCSLLTAVMTIGLRVADVCMTYCAAYLTGLLFIWICGDAIVHAFSLFYINCVVSDIPIIFGLIGIIVGFFSNRHFEFYIEEEE